MKKAVNIIIADSQNRVLILERSDQDKAFPGLWDLPGGGVKDNETIRQAAEREAKEETGLNLKIDENYFYIFRRNDIGWEIEAFGFKAKIISGEIALSQEHTEFRWISKQDYNSLEYTPSVAATVKEFFKNVNFIRNSK